MIKTISERLFLQVIKEAYLTYPYHCCAFKFPHTHNPWEFEKFQQERNAHCSEKKRNNTRYVAQEDFSEWTISSSNLGQTEVEESDSWSEDGIFHNSSMFLNNAFPITTAVCGEIYRDYHEVIIKLN